MVARDYTFADQLLIHFDQGFRTLFGNPPTTGRPNPGTGHEHLDLSQAQRRRAARLMRVNHSGEVSAQALYQGQAITARDASIRDKMQQAAMEENDHLAWCEQRVHELGGHTSYLNPLWYTGSLAIGIAAGAAGDKWSLGFLAETERQVVRHLEGHLGRLPGKDLKSRAILEQMRTDEAQHATTAVKTGAAELPGPVKALMKVTSKVMTRTAYWV